MGRKHGESRCARDAAKSAGLKSGHTTGRRTRHSRRRVGMKPVLARAGQARPLQKREGSARKLAEGGGVAIEVTASESVRQTASGSPACINRLRGRSGGST
jgi:hypothetical protein